MTYRETLEAIKPLMEEHDALRASIEHSQGLDQETLDGFKESADDLWRQMRDIAGARERPLGFDKMILEARHENNNMRKHRTIWEPAYTEIRPVQDGWEAYVAYPRSIYLGEGYNRQTSEEQRFFWRWRAERWAKRKSKEYKRYIERIISLGLYDDYRYGGAG